MLEIMAPVGSYESLSAAIQAGADSIYFGIQGLNMRSGSAHNFTIGDLSRIAEICRSGQMPEDYQSPQEALYPETAVGTFHGKPLKSYLTVNTIMYDGDLDKMRQIIDAASEAGITAIIASDVAAMTYARGWDRSDKTPRIEVHLSTQLNITNVESLKFYAQFADVVVLARELNMEQVKHIHEEIVKQHICGPKGELVRIEMFAHGALCMAVSGKCYMSLHEYNRSANRGECTQVCRHAYDASVIDGESQYLLKDQDHDIQLKIDNKFIMSPKDLKTIHFINKMIDAGVEVFKIEGRARGAEYVKTVVGCYAEAVHRVSECEEKDGIHQLPSDWDKLVEKWDGKLASVFNRGFWNGYYLGQRLGEWSHEYGSLATERKEYAAKTVGWFSKIGIGDFLCEAKELHKGDKILIIGPTTGVLELVLDEIQVDYKTVDTIHKGDRFTIPVKVKIRPSDKVYRVLSN